MRAKQGQQPRQPAPKKHESFDVPSGAGGSGSVGLAVPQAASQVRRHSTGNTAAAAAAAAGATTALQPPVTTKKRGSADMTAVPAAPTAVRGGGSGGGGGGNGGCGSAAALRGGANRGSGDKKAFVHTHSESQLAQLSNRPEDAPRPRSGSRGREASGSELHPAAGRGSASRGRRGSCPKIAAATAGGFHHNGGSGDDARDWQNNARRRGEKGDPCK